VPPKAVLFERSRHEILIEQPWDEACARRAIGAIATAIEEDLRAEDFWPSHPLDEVHQLRTGQKTLYLGAAGVVWAVSYLRGKGAADFRIEAAELIDRIYRAYLGEPDTGEVVPSYFLGEVGILLVHWRLTKSPRSAAALAAAIEKNRANPTNEALWGAPGTMVGALHMLGWTGEQRWADLFRSDAEQLLSCWRPSQHAPCDLWTQDLYGEVVQLIGAGHGFAGNVYPLLRGANLLADGTRERIYDRCVGSLRATAVRENGWVNWPPGVGSPRSGRTELLMQWCHGAPGVVTGLSNFPRGHSSDMEEMLLAAGETIWAAGPLAKGCGLCHGTAGNGYAFLKLHRRTADPLWLDRARRFAMHAVMQWERALGTYGRGRHSLWTGDLGLAVYLLHCITGADDVPGLDILD